MAASGQWVFVASPGNDTVASLSGTVDVMRITSQGVQSSQRLFPSNASGDMMFGWAMDVDGDRLVVSAPYNRDVIDPPGPATYPPGVVYVFERFQQAWIEIARIEDPAGNDGDQFGYAVAISGDHLIVGANKHDKVGTDAGLVYAFELTPTGWVEVQRIEPQLSNATFGEVLAIDGDLLAIRGGASLHQSVGVWEWQGAQWGLARQVGILNSSWGSGFAESLSIAGDTLAVSAPAHPAPAATADGAVLVYEQVATSNAAPVVLGANLTSGNVNFGTRVALDGERLFATDRPPGAGATPGIHRFERIAGQWVERERFTDSTAAENEAFGDTLDVDGPLVVAGAWLTNAGATDAGRAWVYHRDANISSSCACTLSAPCGATAADSGCVNSTGVGARLVGCGTASVASDDLVLRASNIPPSQFVLPFMGDALVSEVVLGAGRRCAGGQLKRFPARLVDPNGALELGPGLAQQSSMAHGVSGVVPGSTWTFQLWYRDNAQLCSNVNLTNGVTVSFRP